MAKLRTSFNSNERKVLLALVLLLGGGQAFGFILPRHHSSQHDHQLHSRCEATVRRQSTRDSRRKGRLPAARRCPHNHPPTLESRRSRATRSNNGNVALSMSASNGNDDDSTPPSTPISEMTQVSTSTAVAVAAAAAAAQSESELRREFNILDIDKNGSIDKAEIRMRLPFLPIRVIDTIFPIADKNNDGIIDFEEYKAIRREMGVSPRVRLFDFLNLPIIEIANITAILLCSFLVAVSTLQDISIPIPTGSDYDIVRHILRDGLHLTLSWDGSSIESLVLINATLDLFNYIFAFDFFVRWYASDNFNPQYLTKPLVVLDIVVVLIPLSVQQFFPFLTVWNSPGLQNLLLLRILRFQRVLSDMTTFSRFEMALGLPPQAVRPFQLQLARVLLSIFTLLSVSSGLIYTTEHIANPDIPDYFSALYFGLTTLTTVGFGDIAPVTPQGRLVVCASILAGVAVIPAQAASLLDAILEYQKDQQLDQSSLAGAEMEVAQNFTGASADVQTLMASTTIEQDETLKEVRSIEETVCMLRISIAQMENNGDSVEDIEDIKESIKDYVNLRDDLECSLDKILAKMNSSLK